ncbi:MAG: hypothetical protein GVY08_00595 [Bacteroidetes bacterium]|jgi:hypothetical protein|nr:hypothetical protein [Bacteroidota bacterium]
MMIKESRILGVVLMSVCFAGLLNGCNTFDTDYERDNPNDPILPKIDIVTPTNPFINYHEDLLSLEIQVQDANTSLNELEINLYSDKDGYLETIQANQSGFASTQLGGLSKDDHYLIAEVVNKLGRSTRDTTLLYNTAPPRASITEAKFEKNSFIQLTWEKSPDPDFEFYKVYRVNSVQDTTLLAEISNVSETTFKDFAPLDSLYRYHINTSSTAFEIENTSTTASLERTLFFKPQFSGISVRKYPDYPALLVSVSSEITGYNYEQDTFIGELSDLGNVSALNVGDNGFGVEIYAVSFDNRSEFLIYDGFSMDLKERISVDYHIGNFETDNRGNIVTQDDSWYRASTRSQFPFHNSSISGVTGRFRLTKTTNDIYIITTGFSPMALGHVKYDDNNSVIESNGWPYHSGPPLSSTSFEVHPHGEYVITAFAGQIYEKAPSLEHRKAINENGRYVDYAFNDSGNLLFALDERGWVSVYEDLNFTSKIEIDMIPKSIFYDNGELILFGESSILKDYFGVVVLPETVIQ